MPSVRFSPTLSTQARATPWASSCCGSRPTSMATARRAASRSPRSSGRATRRACSSRQRGARQRETTATQTIQAAASPSIPPASSTGSAASRPTGRITARQAARPASVMRAPSGPRRKRRSAAAARAPMPQTGWMRAGGSPNRRSSSRAAGRRSRADSALIAMLLCVRPSSADWRAGRGDGPAPAVSGTGSGDSRALARAVHGGGGKTRAGRSGGQCGAWGILAVFPASAGLPVCEKTAACARGGKDRPP